MKQKILSLDKLTGQTREFAEWLVKEHSVTGPRLAGEIPFVLLLVRLIEEPCPMREDMRSWHITENQWWLAVSCALYELEIENMLE